MIENSDMRIVKLLIKIDHFEEYDIGNDDFIDEFDLLLKLLYPNDKTLNADLDKICAIETDIFTNNQYLIHDYQKNPVREKIADYRLTHPCPSRLIIDYQVLQEYIAEDYKLIRYLEPHLFKDKNKVLNLLIRNSESITLLDETIVDIDMMEIILKHANLTIFLILDGDNVWGYQDNWLYQKRQTYLTHKKICDLYIEGLNKYIKEDVSLYTKLSLESRNSIMLAKTALQINPDYICYCGPDVYRNKELMLEMLKINKQNVHYIAESLKQDKDIITILKEQE